VIFTMAKVKFSPMIQDIRGSINNGTFSNLRGQSYLKSKSKTVGNPQTALQKSVRDTLTAYSRRWFQVLSDAQRAGWTQLAALITTVAKAQKETGTKSLMKSTKKPVSGISAYVGLNAICVRLGLTPTDDAPLGDDAPGVPTGVTAVYATTPSPQITVSWTEPAGIVTDGLVIIWAKSSKNFKAVQLAAGVVKGTATQVITKLRGKAGKYLDICADNYTFQLQTVNPDGLKSPGSEIVSVNVPTV
jgi:hypothetical protein